MKNPTAVLGRVLDVIFPPTCVHCGELVNDEEGWRCLCRRCSATIDFAHAPCCAVCGHPFYGVVSGERICPHCEGLRPEFREGRTAVLFKGPARALLHEIKYHRGLHVLRDIERAIRHAEEFVQFLVGAVLVPVPLHPRKLRERGYNQSELLAETFVKATNFQARIEKLLIRTLDTASQTAFDRKARRENLKNAFALGPHMSISASEHYILVDDVFTTGSTLNSCAGVLRRAGCLNLDVATFGHG